MIIFDYILVYVAPILLALAVSVFYGRHLLQQNREDTVVIGAGVFPDVCPILMALERGHFSPLNVRIKFIDWSAAPDYLGDKCDVIFGPKGTFGSISLPTFDLAEYKGFAIISHWTKSQAIRTYAERKAIAGSSTTDDEILRDTLAQMKGERIVCMSHDIQNALRRCLQKAKLEDVTIIRSTEPISAFQKFSEAANPDKAGGEFFVGGLTQLLQTLKIEERPMKVLISQAQVDLDTVEQLGFMTKGKFSDEKLAALEKGWFQAIKELSEKEEAKIHLLNLINTWIGQKVKPEFKIDLADLDQILYKYESFKFGRGADDVLVPPLAITATPDNVFSFAGRVKALSIL